MWKSFELCGRYFMLMRKVFSRPDRMSVFWRQLLVETEKLGVTSIGIVAIISVFIGAVITLQSSLNLSSPFIPKMYVGYMTRETMVLEFSSTMVALILAGKIGSNIASEIGSMRITEQIDAMEIMGVNSANYLIFPKIIAATVFNPFLMLLSFIVGLFGGWLMVAFTGIITTSQYIDGLQMDLQPHYITYSMVKMAVFSFIITSVSSFFGYFAYGGSLNVGRSSTRAIVACCVIILIFNLILTKLLL
ncbi:MAG: ABC transporter permease [Prevotellaceae bacterium]|jgi:phospholipid/cholesterol/gamma-HCH transport system permease protein|nr:ABC transporter permease [Prevotellaceae bacterium]